MIQEDIPAAFPQKPRPANTHHGRPLLAHYLRRGLMALPGSDELKGGSQPSGRLWIWPKPLSMAFGLPRFSCCIPYVSGSRT
jgi:hypothetical protein